MRYLSVFPCVFAVFRPSLYPPLLSHNAPLSANWRLHPPNHWFFSIDYTFEIESWNMQIKNDRKQNMTTKRFSYLERAQSYSMKTPGCHFDNSGPSMSHIWSNSLGRSWEPNKMAQVEIPNRVFGRFVRPLQRLVLNYCKHGGSSRGIRYSIDCWEYFFFFIEQFFIVFLWLFDREYIDKEIVEFATNNPEVTIYVRERNGKHPRIVANFSKLCVYCHTSALVVSLFLLRLFLICLYWPWVLLLLQHFSKRAEKYQGWTQSFILPWQRSTTKWLSHFPQLID